MSEYKDALKQHNADKKKLQADIAGLVSEFTQRTGVKVDGLSLVLRSIRTCDGLETGTTYVVGASLDLESLL